MRGLPLRTRIAAWAWIVLGGGIGGAALALASAALVGGPERVAAIASVQAFWSGPPRITPFEQLAGGLGALAGALGALRLHGLLGRR